MKSPQPIKSRIVSLVATTLSLLALALPGGCMREKGFTDCSGILCQPGQYCFAPGVCESGCTSDVNCADGQECADEGEGFDGEGVCRDGEDEPEPAEGEGEPEPDDPLAACLAACGFFQSCGAEGSDVLSCRNDCPDLSVNQQLVVAGCAEGSCSDARTCLDIECFNDGDCDLDEQCLGNACM